MVDEVSKKYIKISIYKFNKIIREVYCNMASIYLKMGITCMWSYCVRNSFMGGCLLWIMK